MTDAARQSIGLSCRCGEVHGTVADASPDAANHMLCYCDDCQAALHHLRRTDLFEGHGGTDVVQVAPSSLSFNRGIDRIVGLRLTPKGLYRWYASCCNTPLGNSLGPGLPFIGLVSQTFEGGKQRADAVFGPTVAAARSNNAVGGVPAGTAAVGPRTLLRAIRLVLGWKWRGQGWPHPYFDRATPKPTRPIVVLSREQREALRPLCGPRPTATART